MVPLPSFPRGKGGTHVQSLVLGDDRSRNDGRFIASIPDLWDLAAYGDTDKDAVAHVTELASERVRAALDGGQQVPPRRQSSELPTHPIQGGRPAIIAVEVGRREAWPTPPYHLSPSANDFHPSEQPNRSQGRRGGSRGALAHMHAANMRARALSAVIQDIRAAGFISYNAVARELNQQRFPTLRGGSNGTPPLSAGYWCAYQN